MPIAAVIHTAAAVVIPLTSRPPCTIAPAPRKPTPVTICAATRPESPCGVVKTKDTIVYTAAPRQTRMSVRSPAGLSCRSRSVPITAPQAMAANASTICSHGAGSCHRRLSTIRDIKDMVM